jgi:nucleoside-diphosphate-sugar epimerase
MSKILVTGANGYVGKHVVDALSDLISGAQEIIAVDLASNNINGKVMFQKINVLEEAHNPELFSQLGHPDICIHLAWQDGFNHSADSHIANLKKHYDFLRNITDAGCRNVAVMGTMHEIGYYEGSVNDLTPCNPLSSYGIAKNALRQLMTIHCQGKANLKWLRAFYITGDDFNSKSIFSKILQFEAEGKTTFPFTDGKNKYDFIDVKELGMQIAYASLQSEVNGIINVCSGKSVTLKDKVEQFLFENNLKIRPEYGVFQARKYDSPEIFGDATKIVEIIQKRLSANR